MEYMFLFIFALVASIYAGPIQEIVIADQCARQCTVSNKFSYEAGKTYEFTYTTELRTAINGASEDQAGVDLSAKVYLDFVSKCDAVLRLSDVKLMEQVPGSPSMKPVTTDLISALEQNPLTVSFQDGSIEELCLSQPENDKVLNIKRGILSIIQNNMDDINMDQKLTESDVSGKCETEYTSSENGWNSKLIKKSKNLLGCTGRQGSNSAIQGIPYTSNSEIQSLPLLKSTHVCEQEIKKSTGQLQTATCHEVHNFAPFSRLGSGATTHNTQTLKFVKEYDSVSKKVQISERVPIQFQHSSGKSTENSQKDMEQKLMEICSLTTEGVTPETPKLFTSLVYLMKTMKSEDLVAIYQKIQTNEICSNNNKRVSKFFLDSLPMSGTLESLKLMVELLTTGQVTGVEAEMWLASLAFIQNPSMEMIAEVKSLLAMKKNQEKAMLSVSSLVNTVCKKIPGCENLLEVKKIISLLENSIAQSCKITDNTMQTSLLALRAIGNAGFGTGAIPTLVKCIKRTDNPIEIRLSAIEAFRRIPCKADKSIVMNTLINTEEDSEIRIAAYKALMECPSDYIIKKVKIVLEKEEVNQVGSYIWSHLTNLMETSDPHKQTIRSILEDESLKKEFNLDNRKFSRNYEKSLFVEKINSGAVADGDLIWSSKSFIPRSAMVNLTVDLFGNAVNLFEIGGRVEGLEYFLESYFGPSGYFSDARETSEETAVDVIKSDKVDRLDKRNTRSIDELRGSLYLRVFGNELRYMNFQGLDSLFAKSDFNVLDMLMKLGKDNDYQYTHSSMIMDSTLVIPTSSGIPINLTVNGTATVDLKASGKMDIMKLTSSPSTLDINGIIRPSAAVVVSSIMGIDALNAQVGIKMVSTLHSRTSVQGKISLTEGSILDAQFDLPDEKQEIISVSSSFYTVHSQSEREQKMITENRQEYKACSGDKISKIMGLELCGELEYPNASLVDNAPYFPLTGPVKAGVTLYKRDQSMKGYKLQARSTHTADENIVRFSFSTPNSNVDRSFGVDVTLNKAQRALDVSFNSPWKKADFKGIFQNERSDKGISGKMNWDGSARFDIKVNLHSEKSGPGMKYTPTLKIAIPGVKTVDLDGSVQYVPWKFFDTEMSLSGIRNTPMTVKASVQNKPKMISASASMELSAKQVYSAESSIQTIAYKKKIEYKPHISIRTPTQEVMAFGGTFTNVYGKNIALDMVLDKVVAKPVMLKANLITKTYRRGRLQKIVRLDLKSQPMDFTMKTKLDNRNGKTFAMDTDLKYVIRKIARDSIKIVSKLMDLSSKTLTKAKASINVASKRSPSANFKLISNINHNKRHSEVEADMAYGPDFKDVKKQISFSLSLDRAIKSLKEASAKFNGNLCVGPDFKIVTQLEHAHDPKSLISNIMLRVNKDAVTSSLNLKDASKDLKNLIGEFELKLPGKTIVASQVIKENAPHDFVSTMQAEIGKSKHTIVTTWKKISPSALTLSTDIKLNSLDHLKIDAEYTLKSDLYKFGGSVTKAKSRYSMMATSQIDSGKSIQISTDLECPSRRVIGNFEATKSGSRYTGRSDVRWNADRDDTQRVTIIGNGEMTGSANVQVSLTIQYPSRTIAINLRNSVGSKYATHVDFQWEPTKVLSFDGTFGDYTKANTREILSTIKFRTPFSLLKTMDITLKHEISSDNYKTNFDAVWNPKNTLSGTLTVRKPLSISNVNMDFIGKAPSLGYKNIQASIQHNTRNGIASVGKLTLNRQSAQIDLSFTNKGSDRITDVKGQIDIKTSYRQLKTATVTFSYKHNGRLVDTSALVKYNKNQIGIEGTTNSRLNGIELQTVGAIIIYLPSDSINATWDHKNTKSDMTTSSELSWGNKRVSLNFNGHQDLSLPSRTVSATLEIKTPFSILQDAVFQINHLHKRGQIDSTFKVISSGNSIATVEGKYLRENGKVSSRLSATNPWYDSTVAAVLNADYESSPQTVHMEMSLTPLQTLVVDGSFSVRPNNDVETSIIINIPNKKPVTISASRQKQAAYVQSEISCKYSDDKTIKLESQHSTGDIKQLKLEFTSPYTKTYTAEGMLQKIRKGIRANANIEAEPFIGKWSLSGDVDSSNGISGNIRVNTPYQSIPYSQVSVLSEIKGGSRQSTVSVEYQPGKIIKASNMFLWKSLNNMQMTMELSTPFNALQYTSVAFMHQGGMSAFSTYGEIEFMKEKMSAETKLSTRSGIEGSLSIKSPFTEDISASITHDGNLNSFVSHGEITMGKTISIDLKNDGSIDGFACSAKVLCDESTYTGKLRFNLGPKMTTEITIETPISKYESISFSQSFEGSLRKFTGTASLLSSGYGDVSTDVKTDLESGMSIAASLQTPLENYRNMKFVVTHEGSISRFFSSHMEYTNGNSVFSGDMKLNTDPKFDFELKANTPLKALRETRLSLTQEGQVDNFKINIEAQLNKFLHELDLICNIQKKYDIDLTMRSPYIDTIKASLDHWGSWRKFQSKLSVRSGKDKMLSSVRFAMKPSLNAMISVKTPFTYLKNQQFSIKHAGISNSFKCNMQYICNGKTYIGDATFQNLNDLNAEMNLKGPTFRPINVAFSHSGNPMNFKSSASTSSGKKAIKIDATFNAVNGIKGNIGMTTPFDGFESIKAAISHTGEISNFKSHGEVALNKQSSHIDVVVDASRDFSATISLTSPFKGLNDITSAVKFQGALDDFNTFASLSFFGKSIETQASFKIKPTVYGDATLRSNIQSIGNFDASFNHDGNWETFNTNGEFSLGSQKTVATASFDSRNGYNGRFGITSPYLKKTVVNLKHNTNDDSVNTEFSIGQDDTKKYGIGIDMKRTPFNGILILTTPHSGFESTTLAVQHDQRPNNLRSSASFELFGKRYEGEITYDASPDKQLSILLSTPIYEDIELRGTLKGVPINLNSELNYLYGKESKLLIETSFNIDGPYSGSLKVSSPLMKNIKASFSHTGKLSDFSSDAQLVYAGKRTDLALSMKVRPNFETSLRFTSPLTKDLEMKFNHYGPLTDCNTQSSIVYGGQKHLDVNGLFRNNNGINGDFIISTSVPGLSQIKTTFSHDGNLKGFQCHGQFSVENVSATGGLTFSPSESTIMITTPMSGRFKGSYSYGQTGGSVHVSTPYTNDIKGSYEINGNLLKSLSQAEMSYGSSKLFDIQADMNYPRSGEISIRTPFRPIQMSRVMLKRSGEIGGNAVFELNGAKHEGDVTIETNSNIFASASVNSPLLPQMSSSISYTGKPSNFQSHAEFTLKGKIYATDVQFSHGRKIEGSMTVTYPSSPDISLNFSTNQDLANLMSSVGIFYGPKTIFNIQSTLVNDVRKSVSLRANIPDNTMYTVFTYDGVLTNFKAHVEAALNDQKVEADATFLTNPMSASVSVASLFASPMKAAFNFDGHFEKFLGHGEFSIDDMDINGDLSFGLKPLKIEGSLNSPMTDVKIVLSHDGTLKNFRTTSAVTVDNKKIDFDAFLNIETALEGSAYLNIPSIKPIKLSFEHTSPRGNMRNQISVLYGQSTWARSNITISKNPFTASISVQTPIEGYKSISGLFTHSGEELDFNNHAEIIIQDQKSECDMSFNFGSKLEGKFSTSSPYYSTAKAEYQFTGTMSRFSSNAEFKFGDNIYAIDASVDNTAGFDLSVVLNTPLAGYKTVTSKITHFGQYPKIDSFVQLKTGRRNIITASSKIENTNGISGKVSVQSVLTPTVQVNIEHAGQINDFNTIAEIRINGKPSSANLLFKTTPSMSGAISVASPFTSPLKGSFDLNKRRNEATVHVEGSLGAKSVVGDASIEIGNTNSITATIKTPFENFEEIKGSFKYVKQFNGFQTNVNGELSGRKLETEVKASWSNDIIGSITIKTPFEQFRHSSADISIRGNFPSMKTEINSLLLNKKYSFIGEIDRANARIVITTPFQGFEDQSASVSYKGTYDNMQAGATVICMNGKVFTTSFQNTLTSDKAQIKSKFETPYTEDISFDLMFDGQLQDFSNIVSFAMGEANTITSTTSFKLGKSSMELDTSLKSQLTGYSDEQKMRLSYEGIFPNIKASSNAKILGSYFSLDTSLQNDDSITGMLSLKTPFTYMKDIGFNFKHTGSLRSFSTKTEVQYDTDKNIEGSLQYVKYGWRRLQTALNVKTPFTGFEVSKMSYRHTASVDSFECDADLKLMRKDFNGNVRASLAPLSASVSVSTPFENFEQISADSKLAYDSKSITYEGNVQYMQGKAISVIVNADHSPSASSANLRITTPFTGYETSELRLSSSGTLTHFQSTMTMSSPYLPSVRAQANMRYDSPSDIDGSLSFTSQVEDFESLSFTLKNEANRGKYNSKVQMSWAPAKSITFDGTFDDKRNFMGMDASLKTPFSLMRQLTIHSETENRNPLYTHKFSTDYNGKRVFDMDISTNVGVKKSASLKMRSPRTLLMEIEGSAESKYEATLIVSQDIVNSEKGVRLSGVFDPSTNAVSLRHTCPTYSVVFDGTFNMYNTKSDLVINGIRYGYDMTMSNTKGDIKLALPSRSLQISGSHNSGVTEGSLMWDADKDETKKIGFRSVLKTNSKAMQADVTLMMPSIGKDVQIDSQMNMNKGRVLFDGKTELSYSRDSRKKFTIVSRLEDISNSWSSTNYSLTFGISQPSTSVDMELSSQFGNSEQKMTGGLNMRYQTVRREVKTFSVFGAIDKSRDTFSFDVDTPMKKIGINGNAKTNSPYRLSLSNTYDNKRPLNTILSIDSSKRSVEFQMNYDLDNPNSEFHLTAKYVNSSALAAEMFHVVNRQRVTDALFTMRLNSSSLLHNRIHWRPEMINDLKTLTDTKLRNYGRRLHNFIEIASDNINYEVAKKAELIGNSFQEELQPIINIFDEMYENNDYHIREITDVIVEVSNSMRRKLVRLSEVSEEYINIVGDKMEERLSRSLETYRQKVQETLLKLERASGLYNQYADHVFNISKPIVQTVNDRYNKYLQYMNQIDASPVSNMAEKYTSAIYGARDVMASGLNTFMNRNDVKYVKSFLDRAIQQGSNAYKYWEIRENTEMVARALIDWMKEEIENEISDIKATVMGAMKSRFTVYDPKNGEIQMEVHLPIPLKSLDVIPEVDYMPYITKAKSYIPNMPSVSMPSTDVRTWLPPFDAMATIQGNKITTFDGLSYDMDSSCTFMLARDFVNSNFSVVLHKERANKTLVIVRGSTSIKIFSNGKVSVNGKLVDLPAVAKDVIVTSLNDHLTVSVPGHLDVDYYKDTDTYMIKMNGYYFGKTNGLLGSYDNEPSNDLMTSFGKAISSTDRFAKTWDVGTDRCR